MRVPNKLLPLILKKKLQRDDRSRNQCLTVFIPFSKQDYEESRSRWMFQVPEGLVSYHKINTFRCEMLPHFLTVYLHKLSLNNLIFFFFQISWLNNLLDCIFSFYSNKNRKKKNYNSAVSYKCKNFK